MWWTSTNLECATYTYGRGGRREETPSTLYWNKKRILGECSRQNFHFFFDSITGKRFVVVASESRIRFRLNQPMLDWDMTTERFIFELSHAVYGGGTGYLNPDDTMTPNVIVYAF